MKNFIKKHWIILSASILALILIWINFAAFQPSLKKIKSKSEKLVNSIIKSTPNEDIIEKDGQYFVANSKKIREHLQNEKAIKKVRSNPNIKKNTVNKNTKNYIAPKITPSSIIPLKFDRNFKHKNIFKPFYTAYKSTNKDSSKEKTKFDYNYKGYYWLNESKIAIIKANSKILYKKLGDMIDGSDYIISAISLEKLKIKNIHNSEEYSLAVREETK